MQNRTNASVVSTLATATLSKLGIAHRLDVDVTKLPTDPEFRRAECLLAFAAGTHRNGAEALWNKAEVDTAEYIRGVRESGESVKGYRIGVADKAEGAARLKRMTDLGIVDAWEKKHGVKATLDFFTEQAFRERVATAEAEKAAKVAKEAAEIAELKKLMS